MDREPHIAFVEMPEILRSRYQYYTQATMAKLRGVGYAQPATSLESGVSDYVQNYLMTEKTMRS